MKYCVIMFFPLILDTATNLNETSHVLRKYYSAQDGALIQCHSHPGGETPSTFKHQAVTENLSPKISPET